MEDTVPKDQFLLRGPNLSGVVIDLDQETPYNIIPDRPMKMMIADNAENLHGNLVGTSLIPNKDTIYRFASERPVRIRFLDPDAAVDSRSLLFIILGLLGSLVLLALGYIYFLVYSRPFG